MTVFSHPRVKLFFRFIRGQMEPVAVLNVPLDNPLKALQAAFQFVYHTWLFLLRHRRQQIPQARIVDRAGAGLGAEGDLGGHHEGMPGETGVVNVRDRRHVVEVEVTETVGDLRYQFRAGDVTGRFRLGSDRQNGVLVGDEEADHAPTPHTSLLNRGMLAVGVPTTRADVNANNRRHQRSNSPIGPTRYSFTADTRNSATT